MVLLTKIQAEVPGFLEILGLTEKPLGMFYSPVEPAEGFFPQNSVLPGGTWRPRGRWIGRRPSVTLPVSSA